VTSPDQAEQAAPVGEPTWDGITRAKTISDEWAAARGKLAYSARAHDWRGVFEVLGEFPGMVNCSRLGGVALYSPLHHAAWRGADRAVVERLIAYGAWRTLRTARGERPVDIAARKGRTHLLEVLEPVYRRRVPAGTLAKLQAHLHEVIRGRVDDLVRAEALRLPELEPLLELANPCVYFPVPGMYGGFEYTLQAAGANSTLAVDSWCRVCGGSGQRHLITAAGSTLIEDGLF
jgi:hypothetical protein